MKRTPLRRKTPLRRTNRLRSRNPERCAKRYARDFGDLAAYVRTLPCAACGRDGPSDAAHVRSRGAGGHAWGEDGHSNILPMCRQCHTKQHAQGWSAIHPGGRDWAALAARTVGEA